MSDKDDLVVRIEVPEAALVLAPLFGPQDQHRRMIERRLGVKISARGTQVQVRGDSQRRSVAERLLVLLIERIRSGGAVFLHDIDQAIGMSEASDRGDSESIAPTAKAVSAPLGRVTAKTKNQQVYLDALRASDLVFATGPAGTGKTYLAMAAAVEALKRREVERIILARPAVEAGERLGFLPGGLAEKVNPYLRPLHDALFDLMGMEAGGRLIETGIAEVAPLAFMRGRTLNRAFVILDEAQNTTREQMKMFLTRLGYGSRAVVTGDVTQVDLERGQQSGLIHVLGLLRNIDGIGFVQLQSEDVVRHGLVRAIVQAYENETNQGRVSK